MASSSSKGKVAAAAAAAELDSCKENQEKGKAVAAATEEKKKKPAAAAAPAAALATATTTTKKKKKTRRYTEQEIRFCIIAEAEAGYISALPHYEPPPPLMETLSKDKELLARMPQEVLDVYAMVDAMLAETKDSLPALEEELRMERKVILDQYYAKGYAEYEVDTDEEEEEEEARAAAPRPAGRRRFRPGLVKRAGRTRKLI